MLASRPSIPQRLANSLCLVFSGHGADLPPQQNTNVYVNNATHYQDCSL